MTRKKLLRRALTVTVAAAMPACFAVAGANASQAKSGGSALTYAVYGDAPYGTTPTDDAEFKATPAFIASINNDPDVSAVVHVGDIHSGKQYCTESYDRSIYNLWTSYADPLVYTPGDNEWTDCNKSGEGGGTYNKTTKQIDYLHDDYAEGNPVDNLALIRQIFFAQPGRALGGGNLPLDTQAQDYDPAHPTDSQYVENVLWERRGIVFVTLNIPGGSNNDADPWYKAPTASDQQTTERLQRTGADLRWLDHAFAVAGQDDARGVVVLTQADMWDPENSLTNYDGIVDSLASHTSSFGRPVLLFNGDSHVYRSDNPLQENAPCLTDGGGATETPCTATTAANLGTYEKAYPQHPGYDVSNFHRITVHGSTFPLEWLKLAVHDNGHLPSGDDSFGPFSWQRMPQPKPAS